MASQSISDDQPRIYRYLLWLVILISIAPYILHLFGYEFSAFDTLTKLSNLKDLSLAEISSLTIYETMRGSFVHTVIELCSAIVAFLTAILAFTHFYVKRDPITPVIGMGMLWSGCIDIFHVLSATGLLYPLISLQDFIFITWGLSRTFNAAILLFGATTILLHKTTHTKLTPRAIAIMAVFCGLIAFIVIHLVATTPQLPQALYPEGAIKRPWAMPGLILFALATFYVFPTLHKLYQSHFSYALWLSAIPATASLAYAAFGTMYLFDGFFNASIGLKLAGYSVLFFGLVADYTRKCKEEIKLNRQLRERERRIRTLFENTVDVIITIDQYGKIKDWNPQAEAVFEYCAEEAEGEDIFELIIPEDTREELRKYFYARVTKDKPVLTTISELTGCTKSGKKVFTEYSLTPSDSNGRALFTVFLRDITMRKEMSMRMIQMDRLAAVGTLAAGVAHEINNPMAYVAANIDFAYHQLSKISPELVTHLATDDAAIIADLTEIQNVLKSARDGTDRITEIIHDLKLFSRDASGTKAQNIDIRLPLELAIRMISGEIQQHATLTVNIANVPPVFANESRLSQVFLNLLVNAIQTIPKSDADHNEIIVDVFQQEEIVCVEITDTGKGILPEHLNYIFDPFFTTKDVGEGTGLGLSLSRQIVEDHGGKITVRSQVGKGSTFRVCLPTVVASTDNSRND